MKKYRKENKIKEHHLSEKEIFQNIDDPELRLVISDVMVHSEDYDISMNDIIDDQQDWF